MRYASLPSAALLRAGSWDRSVRGGALALLAVVFALMALSPVPLAAQPAAVPAPGVEASSGRCGVCHPAERVKFETSRHAREEVRCVSCHGGNDKSLELPVAHGGNFRGRPSRQSIPKLCASCHADEDLMRPYNLPTDQYALYLTSGHGKRLARGDTKVAVCSDCHGAHAILPPSDPASSVFTLNIPRTCGTCHGDSTLMVQQRGRRDAYAEYMTSVHARELFDAGNSNAPTCVSCHGVHGAAPPEVGDVDKVCGHCHTAERRYFVAGPHRKGLTDAGLPECASCHGDHAIQAAQPVRLSKICADCHGEDSVQMGIGARMYTEYQGAADEIGKAEELIAEADAIPIATDDYRARLEEAKTYLRETLPTAHAVQEDAVASLATRARSVGNEIESEIHHKLSNLRVRKFVLIVFWFYLLLTILVLRRFQKQGAGG